MSMERYVGPLSAEELEACYTEDGAPVRCSRCGSTRFDAKTVCLDSGVATEVEYWCPECGANVGYMAYGAFDGGYRDDCLREAAGVREQHKELQL